jgi:hypothetical protein
MASTSHGRKKKNRCHASFFDINPSLQPSSSPQRSEEKNKKMSEFQSPTIQNDTVSVSRKQTLERIHRSPFAISVEWSYPASPPLGFQPPKADEGKVQQRLVWDQDVSDHVPGCVLEKVGRDIAYQLPGGLLHLTSCGEIRLCHVLQREYNDKNSSACKKYRSTPRMVAIKMDKRSTMRHLHDDEDRWDHKHHPFPENPWKEVSALQLIESSCCSGNTIHSDSNNVISLVDALYEEDCLYEVLPYYPKSLYWLIHRQHSQSGLDEITARHFFVQLLHAIHAIHSHGICHRDISSNNLLVDETRNQLILIDFGMCLRVPYNYPDDHYTEDVTEASPTTTSRRRIQCQSHCGKLRFMAPEMYAQQNFDGLAIDLWSAAVVLFEMVTAKLPYQKPCDSDAGYHDLMDDNFYWNAKAVHPCLSWGHPVSVDLSDLLQHMFRPNPKDRLSLAEIVAHPWVIQWTKDIE